MLLIIEESQTFHDDLVCPFCLNKRIHRVQQVQTQLHAARHGLHGAICALKP